MPTYNSDATVYTLADAVAQSADLKAKVWSRVLEVGSNTVDDFTFLEGAPESTKPFWKKKELAADGGDTVVFSTIGDVGGPGVRGEAELTGNTSKPRMGTYTCQVDFWRDAVELTKKQIKFIATGKSLENVLLGMLAKKLGRQKMYDMMQCLIKRANGNILRPNNKTSRDTLRHTDTLTTSFFVEGKARLQGLGARTVNMTKSPSGSPVFHYLVFAGQDAMQDIRNSTSFQNALLQVAAAAGSGSELFNGKLVDWQGLYLWEHTVVDPDADDSIGSPIAPKALLGTAITATDTAPTLVVNSANTKPLYFGFFPGYDWIWVENQTAAPDSNTYYVWIVNPPDAASDPGKAGFYSYVGTGNVGNTLVTSARLRGLVTTYTVTGISSGTYATSAAHGLAIGDTFQLGSVVGGSGTGVAESTTYIVKTVPLGTTFTATSGVVGNAAFTGSATSSTITVKSRGGAAVTIGNVTFDSDTMTDVHGTGSYIIPANAYGVPIGYSFIFGAGAALRAYGSIEADPIYQDRDYKFVKGMGYESIFGQTITKDTQGKPRNYVLLEHAIEHPGITVPYNATA